jgi:hypothetical protein
MRDSGVLGELLERLLGRHGLVLGGIFLVAAGVFGNALFVHPLDGDNLVALSVGPLHSAGGFFTGAAHSTYRPAYRPAAELTLWLQYHLVHLQTHSYFAINIFVWALCACAVYAYAVLATGARALAAAAGLATMLDARGVLDVLWILERQTSLALLCGFSALLLVLSPPRRPRLLWGGVLALILVASLAKEYGLAFIVAVPLLAWLQSRRWRPVALASAGSLVLYAVLRLGAAGGATTRFCDQMGYFRSTRTVCYSDYASLSDLKQHAWNALASFVGTFFPQLFDDFGALVTPGARGLVVPAIVTAAALLAFVRRPRFSLPLLALIVLNALLSFVLYRTRNQVIGVAALYAAAAIGLEWAWVQVAPRLGRYAAAAAAVASLLVVAWLAQNAVLRPRTVQSFQQMAGASDPCPSLRRYHQIVSPAVVRGLQERYGLPPCR